MNEGVHVNLDNAWDARRVEMRTIDAPQWGPRLRYTAPQAELEKAFAEIWPGLHGAKFVLYGSGDFHHLAAWWLRGRIARENLRQRIVLICFDNHPDWDVRPPRWGCGGWINRALEMREVARASVWGCGNFELTFPSRLFRNRQALELGRLEIHAWAERQTPRIVRMFNCMTGDNWRQRFSRFAGSLLGAKIYISIDMDSLGKDDAVTNWEHGLFTAGDLVWALGELRSKTQVIGGDMCGACSQPAYARRRQRFAAAFDHPKLPTPNWPAARNLNHQTLKLLWPALTGANAPQPADALT